MKVGHYTAGLFLPGGIGSYLRRIVAGQARRGHELVLFERGRLQTTSPGDGFHGATQIHQTEDDAELLRQARGLSLDVLHVHTAVEASAASTRGPCALVRTVHGHESYCPSGTRYLAFPNGRPCPRAYHLAGCTWGHFANRCGSIRPRRFLEEFRRVGKERRSGKRFFTLAISGFVQAQMVRSGADPARIRTLLNPAPAPVPAALPVPTDGPPVFLFLGRLVPGKGAQWLLRAAARVGEPFRLEIAGVGPQEPELRRLARDLGLEARVDWPGWLDEGQVRARMAAARAVVFPSLWHEPAGLVTAEAAASARAVIAARVGGIPEYAGALGNALLVEPGDTDALAGAIRALANDASLAARLGLEGWHRLAGGVLNLESHLDALEAAYVMCRPPPARSPSPAA